MTRRICPMLAVMTLAAMTGIPPLIAQSVSRYTKADGPDAEIQVFASERAAFKIPRTVYGTFLENIGDSIFGGVSAQLLDNPSLETYYASLEFLQDRFLTPSFRRSTRMGLPLPWLPLRWEDGWRFEPRWGEAANSYAFLHVMGLSEREVGIRQAIYLPVHRVTTYEGVLFASCRQGSPVIELSFRRRDDPSVKLASASATVPRGGEWTKLPFRLNLPAGSVAPLTAVDFVLAIEGEHRVSIDHIRLYPTDAVEGLDPDMIKAAQMLKTPLLRYGGNFTSGYHWRDGIGPVDKRPTRLNQSWGYPEHNEFGTDELMAFCRLIGARAQICLNLGSGTAQEAREWLEYCQGPASSGEGARRATNGHRDPHPIAAWEMGNELWGDFQIGWHTPESHVRRYQEFYQAVRDLVPADTMIIATGGDPDVFREWNTPLLQAHAANVHYLSTHFVVGMHEVLKARPSRDFIWNASFALPVGVGRALRAMREHVNSFPAARDRVKVAFTEYLFWAPEGSEFPRFDNLGGALVGGAWMNMLLSQADFVPVADMTGLIDFAGIHKKRSRVFLTPQAWAFSLYSTHAGDTPVTTNTSVKHYDVRQGQRRFPEIPDVPQLDTLATVDSSSGNLTLFVASRDWKNAIPATIRLKDFAAAPEVLVHTLTGDSILARNDDANPDAIRPTTATAQLSGDTLRYTFPARSLTVLSFRRR